VTVVANGQASTSTSYVFFSGALNAYSVQVRFQASDLPLLTGQASSVSLPLFLGRDFCLRPQTSSSTSAHTSSTGTLTPPPNHSLSPGAAAGIGIGVAVAVILVFIGALLLVRRLRYRQLNVVVPENAEQMGYMASSSPQPPNIGVQTGCDSTRFSASPHNPMVQPAGGQQSYGLLHPQQAELYNQRDAAELAAR